MYEYMTRHMIAKKALTYAGCELVPGDRFVATPDDAGYFIRQGKAEDAPKAVEPAYSAPVEPASADETPIDVEPSPIRIVRRRGRPPRQQTE